MTDQYVDVNTNTRPDAYKEILRRTRKEHRLLSAHWEITYRCNERCTHCYLDVLPPGSQLPGELTTEEAKGVIDQLAELGALTISFSGGEVFLRKDIFEIAGYARKKGFAVRFFTNGILIKPPVADKIAAIKPVVVELSVYGVDAETHDGITQVPGSFDLTLRAVKLLLERNVRCIIKTPVMKENIHQIEALKQLAADLGITFQYDLTIIPKHTGDLSPLKHRPTDDQLLDFLRERVSPETWHLYPYNDDFRFCSIGMNSLDIGPYGEIYTCVGARVSAGNVRQAPLHQIWKESPVWEQTTNLNLANLPVCATCELRQFCVRCHGTAAFEDGDMLGCSSVAYREARLRRQAYLEKGVTHA
ncbi:MAG: radical SAM protein [Chloroflexi bacterium]|nr:radical SAM protein [Chloroflexota bacterium]MCI0576324.1 radical SAM protein [Chloroflexota bacterium]MCI0650123.1 radical SAM protein [Chloroflexota bacterium]MCI0731207.1 radical SAM protein [Chloroflexota bacterium]